MGVQGLWHLIESTGRPVTLESLEGKVLAIDVSIWLNQSLKGMRDKFGNPIPNAHLLSLYHRLCKLLYYRIKPIFVFDGGVPILKKQTLVARHNRRIAAADSADVSSKKLLTNILKHHAVSATIGDKQEKPTKNRPKIHRPLPKSGKDDDMFDLPPLPRLNNPEEGDSGEDYSYEEQMALKDALYGDFDDMEEVDVDSEEFKCLPPEIKHEILTEIKEKRKRNRWAQIHKLPQESQDFSSYQLAKVMKQSRLSKKIENVRKEMKVQNTGEVAASVSSNTENTIVESNRVVSEDSSHYILIKGLAKLKEDQKPIVNVEAAVKSQLEEVTDSHDSNNDTKPEFAFPDDFVGDIDFDEDEPTFISSLSTEANPSTSKMYVNDSSNCEDIAITEPGVSSKVYKVQSTVEKITTTSEAHGQHQLGQSEGGFVRDDDSEDERLHQLTEIESDSVYFNNPPLKTSPPILGKVGVSQSISHNNKRKAEGAICNEPTRKMSNVTLGQIEKSPGNTAINSSLHTKNMIQKEPHNAPIIVEESSSEEEDFIEITINPSTAKPDDELFPLSMFQTAHENPPARDADVRDENVADLTEDVADYDNDADEALDESASAGVTDVVEEPETPIPVDRERYREFDGLTTGDLANLQSDLERESSQLRQEQGKQERLAASVTDQMYMECQELLKIFGVPFIVSPMEAEAQCAYLDMTEQAAGTITDDSDIWLFGGQRVYKNFFNQNKHVEVFKMPDIQRQMMLTRRKLINLALLCGSDYTVGIKGVGGVTALEIMGEFQGSDEQVLINFRKWWDENHEKRKIPSETKVKTKLRQLDLHEGFPNSNVIEAYLKPTIDDSKDKFSWGSPDLDLVRQFTLDKFGWSKNKVDETIVPLVKKMNESTAQRSITSFLSIEKIETANKKSPSKRVNRVLNRMRTDRGSQETTSISTNGRTASKPKPRISKSKGPNSTKGKASVGTGFLQPVPVSSAVPNEIVLSEESANEDPDLFDDPEGDDLLMSLDIDKCVENATKGVTGNFGVTLPNKGKNSGKGKGKGRGKRTAAAKPLAVQRMMATLEGRKTRKRKSSANTARPVILSDSGSSSD